MTKNFAFILLVSALVAFVQVPLPLHASDGSPGNWMTDFASPPDTAQPHTWWHWMNNNISKEGITADLEAMKRAGIHSATIVSAGIGPAGNVKFLTPEWLDMVKFATTEAQRLGLKMGMENCAGWSSSGGPWVTPAGSMQKVVWTETTVQGGQTFSDVVKQPETNVGYYEDIALLAMPFPEAGPTIPDLAKKSLVTSDAGLPPQPSTYPQAPADAIIKGNSIIDLSSKMDKDGKLTWDAPLGKWLLLRFGHTTNLMTNHPGPAEGFGLECDKLSRAAAQDYWNGIVPKVQQVLGPLMGTTFDHVLIDSWEVGCQNWTSAFPQEFKKRCGYDVISFLPVLTGRVVESREVSERFLWDFRRTIADLFAENYGDYFEIMARKAGMKLEVEPYGSGPFEDLRYARDADRVMGEFWWPKDNYGDLNTIKLAAAVAHTNGRTLVGGEAFTAWNGDWTMSPPTLKARGDFAFVSGCNSYDFHRYAHQPWLNRYPGMTMGPFGSTIERTNNWWEPGAAWLKYLARCNLMLSKGLFVADLLYSDDEGAPSIPPATQPLAGFDFDTCAQDTLLHRLSAKDGHLVLPDGMSYRVLVLSPATTMTPNLLHKLKELTDGGATIIGTKPVISPSLVGYPQCDDEVKKLSDELWDTGKIISGKTPQEVLASLGVKPDFECTLPTPPLYIHRIADNTDIYFLSNQQSVDEIADCTFRVSGKSPELWHPDTGKVEKVALYSEKDGRTHMLIHFDPIGSVFVLFRPSAGAADHATTLAMGNSQSAPGNPDQIVVNKAIYGDPQGKGTMDVTAKLNAAIKDGNLNFQVTNDFFGNDPSHSMPKQLTIDYTLNGNEVKKIVAENNFFTTHGDLPPSVIDFDDQGGMNLEAYQGGTYTIQTAAGKTITKEVPSLPRTMMLTGSWDLDFPPNWGAPPHATFDKLISWSESPDSGIKYFSGTATYHKTIQIPDGMVGPGHRLYLDLGEVQVMASVKLNGTDLGVLWKAPYRVEITSAAKAGDNALEIQATNLWPNRRIGDEQLPPDTEWNSDGSIKSFPHWMLDGKPSPTGRFTFATFRHYNKNSPLLPSGVMGPVTLIPSAEVPLK